MLRPALLLAALLTAATPVAAQPWPTVPPSSEEAAPFAIPTLAGDTVRLSDLRGKVAVVNLWATWCGPCVRELPDLARLHREMAAQGLAVVGVAHAMSDTTLFADYAARFGIGFPLLFSTDALPAAYGPRTVWPSTFVVDRRGHVRLYLQGATTYDDLAPLVASLLAEPP